MIIIISDTNSVFALSTVIVLLCFEHAECSAVYFSSLRRLFGLTMLRAQGFILEGDRAQERMQAMLAKLFVKDENAAEEPLMNFHK